MMKHMENTWKNHGNSQVKRKNMMEDGGRWWKMVENDGT